MPVLDPFSAASRPFLSSSLSPSNYTRPAETLYAVDVNIPAAPPHHGKETQEDHAHVIRRPREEIKRQRQYAEPLPKDFPEPLYGHRRAGSVASLQSDLDAIKLDASAKDPLRSATVNVGEQVVGSDEWMKTQVARCLDAASRVLDFR